jgi:predicted small lipoprotein YifL
MFTLFGVATCGQKGPLRLPEEQTRTTIPANQASDATEASVTALPTAPFITAGRPVGTLS